MRHSDPVAELVDGLEREVARLREALQFYADPASYDAIGPLGTVRGRAWRIVNDDGQVARAALSASGFVPEKADR